MARGVDQSACRDRSLVEGNRPQTELRQWFGHDVARWPEFRRRYMEELHQDVALLNEIRELAGHKTVTLVFGAHDDEHNDAVVLKEVLLNGNGLNECDPIHYSWTRSETD